DCRPQERAEARGPELDAEHSTLPLEKCREPPCDNALDPGPVPVDDEMYSRVGQRVLGVGIATAAIPADRPVMLDQLGGLRRCGGRRVVEPLLTRSEGEDPARPETHGPKGTKERIHARACMKGVIIERP